MRGIILGTIVRFACRFGCQVCPLKTESHRIAACCCYLWWKNPDFIIELTGIVGVLTCFLKNR